MNKVDRNGTGHKKFLTLTGKLRPHTIFRIVPVSVTFDLLTYFNIMCEQHHMNSFNKFLNGEKNRREKHYATAKYTLREGKVQL